MSVSLNRYYNNQSFEPGKIASAFRDVLSSFGLNESEISIKASYRILDEGEESRKISLDEIGSICELRDRPKSLSTGLGMPSNFHFLILSRVGDLLSLNIEAPTAEKANKLIKDIEKELALNRVYPNIGEGDHTEEIGDLSKHPSELEDKLQAENGALSCFLSYRFNDRSTNYASELMKFLDLVGVKVATGAAYEPRSVSDKVLSHLEKPIDFVIYIIAKEGESTWLRDEIAVSQGKGYHIIPLVEEGSNFESGILGDLEYIPFSSSHISDTFIRILEAIRFINKRKKALKEAAPNTGSSGQRLRR